LTRLRHETRIIIILIVVITVLMILVYGLLWLPVRRRMKNAYFKTKRYIR